MNRELRDRIASTLRAATVALAVILLAASGSPVHAAPPAQQPSRFFQETGFGIESDDFFAYFQSRGGVSTFGYPVSRDFHMEGYQLQIFQRAVMQRAPDGPVRLLNLLDQGIMPVTSINFSQFPTPDPGTLAAAPDLEAPDYGDRMVEFVRARVPDRFEGQAVNFQRTFMEAVRSPGMGPGMLTMLNLEVWGAPTSPPTYDPNNRDFVYQRFQRGIMHFDASTGTTEGLLLGDWFKSVLTGQGLPEDMEHQMRGSAYLRQYDNGRSLGLVRPEALPNSDLADAFEPQQAPLVSGEGKALLYPDLRTLPPEGLRLGTAFIDGAIHHVLRFGNTVWNAGEGPLELRGVPIDQAPVNQRVYDAEGGFVDIPSGVFAFSGAHGHWHLEGFVRYELWTRSSFDAWQASDRTQGEPEWQMDKRGFCLTDTRRVRDLPGSPSSIYYSFECRPTLQGISVGWGDTYLADLEGQWVDLGPDPLADGQYVLRSVADPMMLILESEGGMDPSREGEEANEAVAILAVEAGRIVAVAR